MEDSQATEIHQDHQIEDFPEQFVTFQSSNNNPSQQQTNILPNNEPILKERNTSLSKAQSQLPLEQNSQNDSNGQNINQRDFKNYQFKSKFDEYIASSKTYQLLNSQKDPSQSLKQQYSSVGLQKQAAVPIDQVADTSKQSLESAAKTRQYVSSLGGSTNMQTDSTQNNSFANSSGYDVINGTYPNYEVGEDSERSFLKITSALTPSKLQGMQNTSNSRFLPGESNRTLGLFKAQKNETQQQKYQNYFESTRGTALRGYSPKSSAQTESIGISSTFNKGQNIQPRWREGIATQEKEKYSVVDRKISTGSGRQINECSEEGYFSRKIEKGSLDRQFDYMSVQTETKQGPSLSSAQSPKYSQNEKEKSFSELLQEHRANSQGMQTRQQPLPQKNKTIDAAEQTVLEQHQAMMNEQKTINIMKKNGLNIPTDILTYDQDYFPQYTIFLLAEEDKNISNFRDRVEKEKAKVEADFDHAKSEMCNLLDDLKMEITQGVDSHFKSFIDRYKEFKSQVIEFKSIKSELPSIQAQPLSQINRNASNLQLIKELEELRYRNQMSKLYQYIAEMQKANVNRILSTSQMLLGQMSSNSALYNSEASQFQLKELKNAFASNLSKRFDPLSSFVRDVQGQQEKGVIQSQAQSASTELGLREQEQEQLTSDNYEYSTPHLLVGNKDEPYFGMKDPAKQSSSEIIPSPNIFSDSSPVQNIKNSIQPQLGLELDNISNPLLKQQLLKQQQQLQQSRQLFQLPKSQELQQQQFQQQDKFNQQMMMQELEQQGQSQQSQQLFNFHATERPSFGFQQDCLSGVEEQQQQELQTYNQPFALKPPSYAFGQAKNYLPGDPSVQSSFKQQYTSPTELRQFSQPFAIQHGEDEEVAEQQINLKENQL